MNFRRQWTAILGGIVISVAVMATATAQTTLRLSHTDTPVGSRQKAAELFAQKVELELELELTRFRGLFTAWVGHVSS